MASSIRRGDSLAVGLAVNYAGKVVVAVLSVVALSLLYQWLGREAFGLFGFFYSLQAIISLLDVGVSSALQRDLASLSHQSDDQGRLLRMRQHIHTLELPMLLAAIVFCACIVAGAFWLAEHWLQPQTLSHASVASSVRWMALAATSQFLCVFYIASLNGLSQFKWVNSVQTAFTLLRFALMLTLAGWAFRADYATEDRVVGVFAVWAIANLFTAITLRKVLMRNFSDMDRTALRMDCSYMKKALVFGASVAATSLLIMAFNQIDKFAASKTLTLPDLGRYAVIWSLTEVLYLFYQPIYTSFFPLLTARVVESSRPDLHAAVQLAWDCMSLAVVPAALTVLVLPHYAIWVWSDDAAFGQSWGHMLAFAMVGATVNAYLFVAFTLVQARDGLILWARFLGLALVFYVPVSLLALSYFGASGGVIAWSLATTVVSTILVVSCFSDIRYQGVRSALFVSAFKTIVLCLVVACSVRWLLPEAVGRWSALGALICMGLSLYAVAAMVQHALVMRMLMRLRALLLRRESA